MTNYTSNAHSATGPGANKMDAGSGNVFRNFCLRIVASPPGVLTPQGVFDCVVALETSPDNTTWTEVARVTGDGWAFARSDHKQRYARANVVGLGTGGYALGTVITSTPL